MYILDIISLLPTKNYTQATQHPSKQADRTLTNPRPQKSKKFFSLPLETKLLAPHPPGGAHHRGYSAPGLEKVTQHTYAPSELSAQRKQTPDCKESFEAGNAADTTQPNIWPPEEVLPGFRAFVQDYFALCARLVTQLLDALSLALSVPDPGLATTHSQQLFQLRLLHYPSLPLASLQEKRAARIAAHSDFGSLTLLWQDSVGGLEVARPDDAEAFVAVQPVEGAVLVNVGDLLARWSNGRWVSAVHRVGAPRGEGEAAGCEEGGETHKGEEQMVPDRYSIPFFAAPDPETLIEALPGCWDGEGRPKMYESVTCREYVQMRMAALYEGGEKED